MKLKILSKDSTGMEYDIQSGNNLIGRWDPQDKSFPEIDLEEVDVDAKVSRKHCIIVNKGNEIYIEDIGSLNGTYLNNTKLETGQKADLKVGDEILIGKVLLKLVT